MLHNQQKKAAVISDLTGFGRCSLTVALPVLAHMGIQCCPVPTAILSNHTGFEDYYFDDYTGRMEAYISKWKKLELRFEGITTGFLGSAGQIQIVRNMIESFADERTNVVIDPVMGDDGKLYGTYTAELCRSMQQLVPYADILIPNVTEACLLTDTPFFLSGHQDDYFQMADRLHRMGAKKVVITGIDMGQWIGNAVFEPGNKPCIIRKKRIGRTRAGTGDLFQALITGEIILGRSLPEAVKKTAGFIGKCMAVTEALKIPDTDGVCFEMLL